MGWFRNRKIMTKLIMGFKAVALTMVVVGLNDL
jgi:hypothetical protein